MRALARNLGRSPLLWILCVAAALRVTGLFWGLPAADGWDDDGFAPRNFLTALALTYTPGSYFTYPPLHAFVLAVLTLPGILVALFQVPSFTQADVIGEITKPGYMTFFAVVARLVSLAMSLGIIWCIAEITRRIAGERAGLFAAAAATLSVLLTYYGQVSNLDVPYLFWASLSLLFVIRGVTGQSPRHFWWAALLAAASVATKDQAYALFAVSLPLLLTLWLALDDWPRRNVRAIGITLLAAGAASLLALSLVDGAVTNPSGFLRRIAFLTGPASQDYAQYAAGPAGWLALLEDIWRFFIQGYGAVVVLLAGLGAGLHLSRLRAGRAVWVAGLLPLLVIISFTLCFNFSALRTDQRFLLPQALFAAVYVGIAADWLAFHANRYVVLGGRILIAVVALFALHHSMAVNAAMLFDPRYDAQVWMMAHMRPGDTVETYGQNAYLPRFPAHVSVSRIGDRPLKLRNPLPGVRENLEPYDAVATRQPRFIVVSAWWVEHFFVSPAPLPPGRIHPRTQQRQFADLRARRYFADLRDGRLGYRLVHVARPRTGVWPQIHIHESLNETIQIFERQS